MSLPKPYYQDSAVTIYHSPCELILPFLSQFDLLLTDPPYGIDADNQKRILSRTNAAAATDYGESKWDKAPVPQWLLDAARAKAKLQVIFGGNYYTLPPCIGPLIWDKENTGDFADGEMAWNNLGGALRIKRHLWNGMIRRGNEARYHPTQKPLSVILWALQLAGDGVITILDPWAGSGTTGRAAKDLGRKATLIERDEKYCEIAAKRMEEDVLPLYETPAETMKESTLL